MPSWSIAFSLAAWSAFAASVWSGGSSGGGRTMPSASSSASLNFRKACFFSSAVLRIPGFSNASFCLAEPGITSSSAILG